MKHASPATIAKLGLLLVRIRNAGRLTERKPGTFYLGPKAFLHFHEDPAGLFADVKLDLAGFTRFAVNTRAEQDALVHAVSQALSSQCSVR
ncbi:MAG TPA: hypothetical protein VFL64_02865 [Rhizobacter sp.]|nr:hypothetical protein [Rhizobacter sp.]